MTNRSEDIHSDSNHLNYAYQVPKLSEWIVIYTIHIIQSWLFAQVQIIQGNRTAFIVWVKASLQKSDTRKSYGKAYIVEKCILPNKCI